MVMTTSTSVPMIPLNNGVQIPQLGFGVFQIPPAETKDATAAALEVGYRHIDTAEMYGNEEGVGQAVRASGIPREELFVTSKLNNGFHAPEDALAAFDATLATLDIGYVDLFLIHWPLPNVGDFVETWKAMEQMYEGGKVRAIGVSNFQQHHLNRLFAGTTVRPAVNQIEVHPYLTQDPLRAFDREHEIATEAWSPIAKGNVLNDPVVERIARRVEQSPAQVVLRWHIQRGDIVFPKSVTLERVKANFDIFGFELNDADMSDISALNKDERTGPDPDHFNYIPE
jgi:2,5-diketo-D-gluconate reductase A